MALVHPVKNGTRATNVDETAKNSHIFDLARPKVALGAPG